MDPYKSFERCVLQDFTGFPICFPSMNIRTVVLIYLVVFVWLVIYHFVLGQDEITFNYGPQVLVGPAGQAYYPPMVATPSSGGSGQLLGFGLAVYLIYNRKSVFTWHRSLFYYT